MITVLRRTSHVGPATARQAITPAAVKEAAGGEAVKAACEHALQNYQPATPMHDRELEILRLLRDATACGIVKWQQSDSDADHYFTTHGPVSTYIQFKWVAFNGEAGSDRDFVEVGKAGHHMAGTEGWWLVAEILAAGNVAHWKVHNAAIAEAYDITINTLRNALRPSEIQEGNSPT